LVLAGPKILLSAVDWAARNPKIGLLGTIASVIGILFTIVQFVLDENDREIVYTVAAPTTIVRSGRLSDLRLNFHGSEITSDVSSVQVAIWNTGRASVKRENVLSDQHRLTISFDSPTVVLDVFAKPTRDIVELEVDKTNTARGQIFCSWNILEQEDGLLLEILYVGSPSIKVPDSIRVAGVIEGKRRIKRTPSRDMTAWFLAAILIVAGCVSIFRFIRTDHVPWLIVRCADAFFFFIISFTALFFVARMGEQIFVPVPPFPIVSAQPETSIHFSNTFPPTPVIGTP
jgi:hypothetical protein